MKSVANSSSFLVIFVFLFIVLGTLLNTNARTTMNNNHRTLDSNISSQSSDYVSPKIEFKKPLRASKITEVQHQYQLPANTLISDIDLNKKQKEKYKLAAHNYHQNNKHLLQQRNFINKLDYQTKNQQIKFQFIKKIRAVMTSQQFAQYQQNIDDKKSLRTAQVQRDIQRHGNNHNNSHINSPDKDNRK